MSSNSSFLDEETERLRLLFKDSSLNIVSFFFFNSSNFFFFIIIWGLITLQYCSGFCHTLTWISHGYTCIPHPDLPSHLPLHQIPLGLPCAPGLSTCLMHPTWAGFCSTTSPGWTLFLNNVSTPFPKLSYTLNSFLAQYFISLPSLPAATKSFSEKWSVIKLWLQIVHYPP